MISFVGAGKRFGPRELFDALIGCHVAYRVGLVGANGTGKTTLLKMLPALNSPTWVR